MTKMVEANRETIEEAAALIRAGEVVAFPTETVYGLGADAFQPEAVDKIFEAKGRPRDNPLIVHVSRKEQVEKLATTIPAYGEDLIETFWPGPLTLIMPARDEVPDAITAGLDTVAIRMPDHPVAKALIEASDTPIAAPSANRSGLPSPTKAEHVWEDMEGRIPLILDGGATGFGLESTVLDLTVEPPMILRPGAITMEMMEAVGVPVVVDKGLEVGAKPKSPGQKYRHYAPKAQVKVVMNEAELWAQWPCCGVKRIALLAQRDWGVDLGEEQFYPLSEDGSIEESAQRLFDGLRVLDSRGVDLIFVQGFSPKGLGMAYMNRLTKAVNR